MEPAAQRSAVGQVLEWYAASGRGRARPGISSTLLGVRSVRRLETNLTALSLDLPPDGTERLTALSAPRLPFPAFADQAAPALQFAGATVDGIARSPYPTLTQSRTRY